MLKVTIKAFLTYMRNHYRSPICWMIPLILHYLEQQREQKSDYTEEGPCPMWCTFIRLPQHPSPSPAIQPSAVHSPRALGGTPPWAKPSQLGQSELPLRLFVQQLGKGRLFSFVGLEPELCKPSTVTVILPPNKEPNTYPKIRTVLY